VQARRAGVQVAVIACLVVVGWLVRLEWFLPHKEPTRDYREFARAVREAAPAPEEIVFFRTEAHALAFHLGRPLAILVQWEHLEERVREAGVSHVVCPVETVDELRRRLPGVGVRRLLANTDRAGEHERPLALLEVETTQAR
jgi:hypothetical protein